MKLNALTYKQAQQLRSGQIVYRVQVLTDEYSPSGFTANIATRLCFGVKTRYWQGQQVQLIFGRDPIMALCSGAGIQPVVFLSDLTPAGSDSVKSFLHFPYAERFAQAAYNGYVGYPGIAEAYEDASHHARLFRSYRRIPTVSSPYTIR